MSRGGVTYTEVFDAYQALLQAGQTPTDRAIHEFIGSGSMSTIVKHRKAVVTRMHGAFEKRGLVHESLMTAVHGVQAELERIYEGKVSHAQAEAQKVIDALQEELQANNAALAELEKTAARLNDELTVARDLLDAEKRKSESLKELTQQQTVELASKEAAIDQLKQSIAKAEDQAKSAIAQQKHFEERSREQLEQTRTVYEKAIEQAKVERNQHQDAAVRASEQLAQVSRLVGNLESEKKASRQIIANQLKSIDQLESKILSLEEKLERAIDNGTQASKKLHESITSHAQIYQEKLQIESKCTMLEAQLLAANDEVVRLQKKMTTPGKPKPQQSKKSMGD